jgi:cysteine synthase
MGVRTTMGHGHVFESILDTVGNTPCIRINNLAPAHTRLYVKAEFFNPAGPVKDRLAVNIIEAAERSGQLQPGQTVVEATSGNTGIGLAMVCAAKGFLSVNLHRTRDVLFAGVSAEDCRLGAPGTACPKCLTSH